jgi:hypothetical protein
MEFEGKHLFENHLKTGINLFLGAGFSTSAKDANGNSLPVGNALKEELSTKFKITGNYSLPQISSILEKTKRSEFYEYLKNRFSVSDFDDKYLAINKLNIKSIFTTNIDDLIQKIIGRSESKYLNDVTHGGTNDYDKASIDFSALHGSVLYPDRPFIFDSASMANTYSNSPRVWNYLSNAIEKTPTLFWGYSLSDSSVIQSLTSRNTIESAQKDKWILLRKGSEDTSDYFRSLGFKIIIGDTNQLLEYFETIQISKKNFASENYEDILYYFQRNAIPKDAVGLQARPISDFFMGNPPIWSDIFGKQIFKTSHFSIVQNKIFSKKNIIVLGIPVSGKTTLMMQLAALTNYEGIKLLFNNIEIEKAQLLKKFLNKKKALIFIDNFGDSIDAFIYLSSIPNVKLIGFDRHHNYGIISHLLDEDEFEIFDVTDLSDHDIQGIYDNLPATQRNAVLKRESNPDYEKDSIFEFISRNVKFPDIRKRYKQVLNELTKKDPMLAEFLVLASYVHFTRTPLSFDMVYNYFGDRLNSYKEVLSMREDLGGLIKDYSGELMIDNGQDYYYPRSIHIAETILDVVDSKLLKIVITDTLYNVPTVQISSYNIYRKRAYDKNIIGKAFQDWKEGMNFYEEVFVNDFKNPYVLQQGALYLSQKHRYTEAFHWIDRAITLTNNRYFSIRNSHAIILFDANINSKEETSDVRAQLDSSMEILEKCFSDDKRRIFHALRYGEQSVQYSDRYPDTTASKYLQNALRWLREEQKKSAWHYELKGLIRQVEERLSAL